MSSEESNVGVSRRQAVEQLGGPRKSQMYRDSERDRVVVLRQLDGWGTIGKRDYMSRTWSVEKPRDYLADSGIHSETISQRTKVERMESGRYENVDDDEVDRILDEAREKNVQEMCDPT